MRKLLEKLCKQCNAQKTTRKTPHHALRFQNKSRIVCNCEVAGRCMSNRADTLVIGFVGASAFREFASSTKFEIGKQEVVENAYHKSIGKKGSQED